MKKGRASSRRLVGVAESGWVSRWWVASGAHLSIASSWEDMADGSSLRWRISLGTVRRPGVGGAFGSEGLVAGPRSWMGAARARSLSDLVEARRPPLVALREVADAAREDLVQARDLRIGRLPPAVDAAVDRGLDGLGFALVELLVEGRACDGP